MSGTKREALSGDLVKTVKFHFRTLTQEEVQKFTVERQKSAYPKAKSDLVIFDGAGNEVMKGRDFGGGQISIWGS